MARIGPDRWPLVSPYLDEVLDITDPDQRAAWVESLRAREPEVAADLEALLQSRPDPAFLDPSAGVLGWPGPAAGTRLGAYTLLTPIGRGGMGTVWLAARSDGRFDRRVAIKLLNRFRVGDEARFRREGRILARLAHPHIAQLLDAGVTADGEPYLVLEYVDGEPIDQYCDRRGLGVPARLRLFLDVLEAVAHAHASFIVHRDIKPSNVLVARDGTVKLLDFGIAKLLEEDEQREAATIVTVGDAGALTPAYAAPEQITGQPVVAATDVYALGLLLYVLLTGRHPAAEHLHSAADLVRAIVNIETMRPSDAVLRKVAGNETPQSLAARRATSPVLLRATLRGDLDAIVGMALKKAPGERFASVPAFASDVRRYLGHEPVAARADSLGYHASKFVRRHRVAVASVALVLTGLASGLYVINRERVAAERRFTQVRQLANRVLALDNDLQALPGATRVRHQITGMAREYLEALRPDAQGDPELALEVAIAYSKLAHAQGVPTAQNLGQYDEAEQSLRAADALLDSILARTPRNRAALVESAQVAQGRMILADTRQQRADALVHARRSVARLDTLLADGTPDTAEAQRSVEIFSNVALAFKNAGLYAESIALAQRALAIMPAVARADEIRAQAASVAADAMRLSGDLDGALATIREARGRLERVDWQSADVRPSTFYNVLWREGSILGGHERISLNRPEEAIAVFQRAFDLIDGWAARDADNAAPRMLFTSCGRELGALLNARDPRRALLVYDRSLERLGEVRNNPAARRGEVTLLAGSSYPLRRLGRTEEARKRLDLALSGLSQLGFYPARLIDPASPAVPVLRALGDHAAETGAPARATEIYEELLEAVLAAAPRHESDLNQATDLSQLYESLAVLHGRAGHEERAAALTRRRLDLWRHWERKLPGHPFVAGQLANAARGADGGGD